MLSGSLSSHSGVGVGWGGGSQQSPGWIRLKEEGHFLKHFNSAVPDSFETAMSAAASLGAQSQKKMQEVISKIPRTAAYETFPGVTNFSVLCPPMSPSTPIPAAFAPHTLKK